MRADVLDTADHVVFEPPVAPIHRVEGTVKVIERQHMDVHELGRGGLWTGTATDGEEPEQRRSEESAGKQCHLADDT